MTPLPSVSAHPACPPVTTTAESHPDSRPLSDNVLQESVNVPNRNSSKGKTKVHKESDVGERLKENAKKRRLAQSSIESLKAHDLEYWASKERIHKLRSETSRLRLQEKMEKMEKKDGGALRGEDHFRRFQQRVLKEVDAEEEMAAEAAVQKLSMARQNLAYPSFRARDKKPTIQSLSRDTKAFVTLIINKLLRKELPGPRASNTQAEFKKNLCRYYSAVLPNGVALDDDERRPFQNQDIWCPIMGEYFGYDEVSAAHIVPYSIGALTMEEVFGKGHTVWSVQNGLLLHSLIETLFDDGRITIVPASDDKGDISLKVRVLERNTNWLARPVLKDSALRMGDLQDRPLKFLNKNRPKRRYLYFMYLMSLINCEDTFRREGRNAELERSKRVFASLTPSLRASMVPAFAAYIGHDIAPVFEDQRRAAEEKLLSCKREATVQRYFECVKDMENS